MEWFEKAVDVILHLDVHLDNIVEEAGIFAYLLLFFVVFAETAFIVTVFLPSDSILFAACALSAANQALILPLLVVIFWGAAILGDSMNFAIGRLVRNHTQNKKKLLFINQEKIEKTQNFYARNGGVTVVISRFVPVLRAFAPFVAGLSRQDYRWFFRRNFIGCTIWTALFCTLGYFFGNLEVVKDHFGLILIGLAVLSILTAVLSLFISRIFTKRKSHSMQQQ